MLPLGFVPPQAFFHRSHDVLGCHCLRMPGVSLMRLGTYGAVLGIAMDDYGRGGLYVPHSYVSPSTDITCEGPRCPFSQVPALPSQLELCEQVFGLSASSVVQAVAQTNSYYGGQTPGATQVLFINGKPAITT